MVLSGSILSGRNKASHPVLQKLSSSFRYILSVLLPNWQPGWIRLYRMDIKYGHIPDFGFLAKGDVVTLDSPNFN